MTKSSKRRALLPNLWCNVMQTASHQSVLTPCMCNVPQQGDALEQGHYSEGLGGLHQEAAEGAAEGQGGRDASEEAGACEP